MEKFNVLIQAYQHLKIHRETLCCILMKILDTWDQDVEVFFAETRTRRRGPRRDGGIQPFA